MDNVVTVFLLCLKIKNKLAKLSFLGKHHNELNCSTVKNYFVKHSTKVTQDWIFIDRNNQYIDEQYLNNQLDYLLIRRYNNRVAKTVKENERYLHVYESSSKM